MHSGGGSIFVFGGMCWWGATKLARSQVPTVDKFVMRDFVEDFLLPKLQELREADINLTIQHDNDAKFHAPDCKESYEREGYRVLPWPAYSPDMNPVEDLWRLISKRLEKRAAVAKDLDELWEWTLEEWGGFIQGIEVYLRR
ncbi:hypothetical protein SAICODRAFT_32338 [Saitoella complicata NRRL Y-17804]|uniref:uncharacterized protein n=1 Tax=Saitoella complicata (strain BCRC 22490 / CBS 7301 / JCM 7358 / NBRC 10748 / NRRL Y-17804) TaxID=698492 RepID=UPI000866E7BA|nr:uncharacterized protein SAICODRAFT_32338 [Saitoella complicata NRRL Y-17804]ODQ49697.1 hypothetical protein SAICODRAFT_32338 [Saitoella complicata NRRL Y-17804]